MSRRRIALLGVALAASFAAAASLSFPNNRASACPIGVPDAW